MLTKIGVAALLGTIGTAVVGGTASANEPCRTNSPVAVTVAAPAPIYPINVDYRTDYRTPGVYYRNDYRARMERQRIERERMERARLERERQAREHAEWLRMHHGHVYGRR